MAGCNDPIRDEQFKFTLKLIKLNVDVKLEEFKLMPHGFLSYNFPIFGMKDASLKTIKFAVNWLQLLLEDEQVEVDEL